MQPPKPRLYFRRGTWMCGLANYLLTGVFGVGYTPKEAYAEWLAQFNRYRLFGGS